MNVESAVKCLDREAVIALGTLHALGSLRKELVEKGIVLTYDQLVSALLRVLRRRTDQRRAQRHAVGVRSHTEGGASCTG